MVVADFLELSDYLDVLWVLKIDRFRNYLVWFQWILDFFDFREVLYLGIVQFFELSFQFILVIFGFFQVLKGLVQNWISILNTIFKLYTFLLALTHFCNLRWKVQKLLWSLFMKLGNFSVLSSDFLVLSLDLIVFHNNISFFLLYLWH